MLSYENRTLLTGLLTYIYIFIRVFIPAESCFYFSFFQPDFVVLLLFNFQSLVIVSVVLFHPFYLYTALRLFIILALSGRLTNLLMACTHVLLLYKVVLVRWHFKSLY